MLFLLVVLISAYLVFIWKFYHFVAHKNILGLNLNRYNSHKTHGVSILLSVLFYFIEYIIILPFIIFFWFSIFTLFLLFLNENLDIYSLLIVSATVVATIRMTSYYSEDISTEFAKYFPLMLLAVPLLNPNFFDFTRVVSQLKQLPVFFSDISIYLIFIVILEIILRAFDLIFNWMGIGKVPEIEDNYEEE